MMASKEPAVSTTYSTAFNRGQLLGHLCRVPGAADADHRLPGEAQLHRIGDGDDLHHAGVDHALDPLPHRGLGQPDRLADARIRPTAVLLQLLDDRLGQLVELDRRPRTRLYTQGNGMDAISTRVGHA